MATKPAKSTPQQLRPAAFGAAAKLERVHDVTALSQRPELADMMEPIRDDVDQLVADLRARPLTPRRYDELEEEWQRISAAGRAVFRGARR